MVCYEAGYLVSNNLLRSRVVQFFVTAVKKGHVLALVFNSNDG